jgi:DNA-binding protein HU-beta
MREAMNQTELIQRVVAAWGGRRLDNEAALEFAVREAFRQVTKALAKDEDVTITGFGRWQLRRAAERRVYDPRRKKTVTIAARDVVKFSMARSDPIKRVRSDPFEMMPDEFQDAEHLVAWLIWAGENVDSWDTSVKMHRAWSATEALRATMLSPEDQRAVAAVVEQGMRSFYARAYQWNLENHPEHFSRRKSQ